MRYQSPCSGGFQVFAVAGVNSVSFGISATDQVRKGLLGFAVERIDPTENERYFMPGFKVFVSVIPNPDENTVVSTWEHPIQSFVWDDFTAKPDRDYEYLFYPIRGKPKNLDRSTAPIHIRIHTEPLFSSAEHDVFFNRGAASSQAFCRRFNNELGEQREQEAYDWLMRDLDDAILKFIDQATPQDGLLCCFYEFRYRRVADALKRALDRGVEVKLIIDAKVNEHMERGRFIESTPREDNLKMIAAAGIPMSVVTLRQSMRNCIAHNKFMVLLQGTGRKPVAVWTGSTNLSLSALAGQTNVGHWIRNEQVAAQFGQYWDLLKSDPGTCTGDSRGEAIRKNAAFRKQVEALSPAPAQIASVPQGATAVFSPRTCTDVLKLYCDMVDSAKALSCITLAFGIDETFKDALKNNTPGGPLVFMLLEKQDKPNPKKRDEFVTIDARNNVYKAWGSYIDRALYQLAVETDARRLGLSHHVAYVHLKFLLRDPLSSDPIVVTGSANFSDASTKENDENMLVIRGDQRTADIYFTEFNRLFNHYYFRSVYNSLHGSQAEQSGASVFLEEDDRWLEKYQPGKLRYKRVRVFELMEGSKSLSG